MTSFNTPEKRASVCGHGLPFRCMLPFPNGSIDADDRAMLMGLYAYPLSGVTSIDYDYNLFAVGAESVVLTVGAEPVVFAVGANPVIFVVPARD